MFYICWEMKIQTLLALTLLVSANAFTVMRPTTATRTRLYEKKNPLFFLFNPYDSKIPEEIKDEIYRAEANTQAAKDRGQRVALYAVIAFTGVLLAFFNAFISELRAGPTPDGLPVDLEQAGFAWVQSNFLFKFLFMNKIGGGICLLGGAGAGLLAEAELDTKRINAEKIYEELERRRASKVKKSKTAEPVKRKKKRRSNKESKRIQALAEVVVEEKAASEPEEPAETGEAAPAEGPAKEGLVGQLRSFYEKADNVAASQALLLNKELEDRGIVEKITDETGLKVVGKEEAAKIQREKATKEDS